VQGEEVVVVARTALSPAQVDEVWRRWRSGEAVKVLSRAMRRHPSTVRDLLKRCGGVRPAPRHRGELRLTVAEREEISRGLAAGLSLRAIAAGLGRAPSTVSREVGGNGGRQRYRALPADAAAWSRACRPKRTRLSSRPGLASMVEEKLALRWSPQQISGWLQRRFPTGVEMHVSHETIYRSLFVQSRGDLHHELTRYLRTRRAMRRPRGTRLPDGRGARLFELGIADRPAEAADRAVPGHWEGDLVFGRAMTAVATLVERCTRYAMLVALPDGHKAE
jgi:IS30 family transposase